MSWLNAFGNHRPNTRGRREPRRLVCEALEERTLLSTDASVVPAGFDLFETDSRTSLLRLNGPLALAAGFFAPGSSAVRSTVRLEGEPLGSFRGHVTGTCDTIVQRKEAADLPAPLPPLSVSRRTVGPWLATGA